jgi:hypothetical protein
MKPFFLIAFSFLILFVLKSHAQTQYEDVVYLKNGSIIRGIIIEQVPNESLKIETPDRNVFVFRIDEVLKITKEEKPDPKKKSAKEKLTKDNIKSKGYTNTTEISIGRSIGESHEEYEQYNDNVLPSIGVQTVNGYQFNHHFSAGLGIGLHTYNEFSGGYSFVPISADLRLNILKGPMTPFVSVGAGYSFTGREVYGIGEDEEYYGGLYFNPAAGFRFNTRKSKALGFSLGYRQQESRMLLSEDYSYPYYYNYGKTWKNISLQYLNLKIAFIF